ncbi:MAG: hypothetical protein OEY63_01800 [Gemmatimonadota bacterium]|nr:hypothetical protein [Gemmatimonadota bacterium]MDH5803792.1 hypothetical protein [Gemmatimonadota bacterium]
MGSQSIDLRSVLHETLSFGYGDLVTRRTGAAVRNGIVELLGDASGDDVTFIDFGKVRVLDLSCADEIVAKLLIEQRARNFVLKGISDGHREAIEPVLEQHDLAALAQDRAGTITALGRLSDGARRAVAWIAEHGKLDIQDFAKDLELTEEHARDLIAELVERGLAKDSEDGTQAMYSA